MVTPVSSFCDSYAKKGKLKGVSLAYIFSRKPVTENYVFLHGHFGTPRNFCRCSYLRPDFFSLRKEKRIHMLKHTTQLSFCASNLTPASPAPFASQSCIYGDSGRRYEYQLK